MGNRYLLFLPSYFSNGSYCTRTPSNSPRTLYKHLMRQCEKLPEAPKKYYKFMVKQSFKQHINETDPERINQIIKRSYEDANWVLNKYLTKS